MKKTYEHRKIEPKWQQRWRSEELYKTLDKTDKPKYYVLDMFPYPSGAGLHVGHPKGYIATDVIARQKMMQGYNVLHPMGWDAFGLPAENYALKNKVHPEVAVRENIAVFKKQLEVLGFTYDWSREINTTDPEFYQWTQWAFLKMYESYYDEKTGKAQPIAALIAEKFGAGRSYYDLSPAEKKEIDNQRLAYEEYAPINWCPSCQTGLANEDLEEGKCERCGSEIEKKPMRQWMIRITKYAERLLQDLQELEWEAFIKTMQENWIGKSNGAEVRFGLFGEFRFPESRASARPIKNVPQRIVSAPADVFDSETRNSSKYNKINDSIMNLGSVKVFTTRVDTLFGVTYVVLAPEHPLLQQILQELSPEGRQKVEDYVHQATHKSEMERTDATKEKTGVQIEGLWAVNPVNGEKVPVWVADYVLGDYGTGAVMAVPAHDERDGEFAEKYNLPVVAVIEASEKTADGVLREICGKYAGMTSEEARQQIVADLEKEGLAKRVVKYKLREWVFSRQRYWGEPIPIIHCAKCGNVPVPEKDLPLKLPPIDHPEPTGTGESPLAKVTEWVEVKCPHCGGPAKRETNTMPQWAGSSWYYLRYLDPHNEKELVDPQKEQYWMPVDFYVGGAEHATRHLIYARFWHKFLQDIGVVSTSEPFKRLQHVGLILAEDGRKMSKRWGNVINPDEIVEKYGADAMRVYEMFMAPFGSPSAWATNGLIGCRRFLERIALFGDFRGCTAATHPLGVSKRSSTHHQCASEHFDRERPRKSSKYSDSDGGAIVSPSFVPLLHRTIKKVTDDIVAFKMNTAISALMILSNKMQEEKEAVRREDWEILLKLLAPFAPHLAEELWANAGNEESIFLSKWPEYDAELAREEVMILPIQVDGKLRDNLEVPAQDIENEAELWEMVLKREKIQQHLTNRKIAKKIYVRGKIFNLVTRSE